MRKIDPRARQRQVRVAEERARRRILRKEASYQRDSAVRQARVRQLERAQHLGVKPPSFWEREIIVLPSVFSLRDNYGPTVSAINAMRKAVLGQNRPVQLYFDHVEQIEPAAILLLTAEADRCRKLRPYRGQYMVAGTYPASAEVFLLLREMGFYKVMRADELEDFPDQRERVGRPFFLPFVSFKLVYSEVAAKLVELIAQTSVHMSDVARRRLVGALKEAMGNAVEHAYSDQTPYQALSDRYWLAGYVSPDTNEAMIILLDQGVGISKTLGATRFEIIRAFLSRLDWNPSDGHMIAAATELHRTSTGQKGRGKGFRDMKRFIDSCDDGELRVLSNCGCYRYMKDGDEISDEEQSIGGTLVEWRVRHEQTVEV